MIHEYKTTRSICGFVEFLSWLGVGLCVISLLVTFGTMASSKNGIFAIIALGPTLLALLICLVVVIVVQSSRAVMDNSVASQKAVIQSAKQHSELIATLKSYASRPSIAADVAKVEAKTQSLATARSMSPATEAASSADRRPAVSAPSGTSIASSTFEEMRRQPDTKALEYREQVVLNTRFGAYLRDRKFETVDDAKAYIDHLLSRFASTPRDEEKVPVARVERAQPQIPPMRAEPTIGLPEGSDPGAARREPVLTRPAGLG